jgi:hypothetical protein
MRPADHDTRQILRARKFQYRRGHVAAADHDAFRAEVFGQA